METPAIVFTGPAEVALQSIPMPPPGPGEVQVRTRYSTVSSGTEGWAFRDLFTWQKTPYPCVPGYQRVGEITALGEGVTGWRVGETVMATVGAWKGPVVPHWGSHAGVANTVARELYRLDPRTDLIDASGAVVAQVGYNAASRVSMQPGDWVAVYGDGIIGQSAAQAARARGARVIVIGHRPERLDLAARHSADAAVNAREDEVVERVRRITGRPHVTAVLDTVQAEAAQREYTPLLEHARGQVVYCGFTPAATWADMGDLQKHELTTHYVSGWTRQRMEDTLQLMAEGRLRLRPLITHLVPASRGPEMYRMILNKSEPFMGITIDWS
jgi:2-desacetyl-2-hydroxyethyl bacteriochlorophyllide A dehydrogenase